LSDDIEALAGLIATRLVHPTPLLLNNHAAAAYCGFSETVWREMKGEGLLPRPRRVGGQLLYHRGDLDEWCRKLPRHDTNLPAPRRPKDD
jgi:hypothetical protein